MLLKHSKTFNIMFAVCSFGIVYSQSPFAFNSPYSSSSQSVSYSGPGSSSVASTGTAAAYSGTGTSYVSGGTATAYSGTGASYVSGGTVAAYSGTGTSYVSNSGSSISSSGSVPELLPPVPDPNVELFAHSLKQLLLDSPVLNAVPDFAVADFHVSLLNVGRILLQGQGGVEPSLAERAAEESRGVGVITKDLYLGSLSHMLAKIMHLNNVLTQETVRTYPRIVLGYVEDYGIENGISDVESVLKAVSNGVMNFANSIGRLNPSNLSLAYRMFVEELKARVSGAEKEFSIT